MLPVRVASEKNTISKTVASNIFIPFSSSWAGDRNRLRVPFNLVLFSYKN